MYQQEYFTGKHQQFQAQYGSNPLIEIETPAYNPGLLERLQAGLQTTVTNVKGTEFNVTTKPSGFRNTVSTLLSDLKTDELHEKSLYEMNLAMALTKQIYSSSNESSSSSLYDYNPLKKCEPAIAKIHQQLIQQFGDFAADSGPTQVYHSHDYDNCLSSLAQSAWKNCQFRDDIDGNEILKEQKFTLEEIRLLKNFFENPDNPSALFTSVNKTAKLNDLFNVLLAPLEHENFPRMPIPTAQSHRNYISQMKQKYSGRFGSLGDEQFNDSQLHRKHLLQYCTDDAFTDYQNEIQERPDQEITKFLEWNSLILGFFIGLESSANDIQTRYGICQLNVQIRPLVKFIIQVYQKSSSTTTVLVRTHFVDVIAFKPTITGSSMQLVTTNNFIASAPVTLAPINIELGYAYGSTMYSTRNGFIYVTRINQHALVIRLKTFQSQALKK